MKPRLLTLFFLSLLAFSSNAQTNTEVFKNLTFHFIGPEGNRTIAIGGIPGNPMINYIGAASGGLWKTEDGGVTWKSIFDDNDVSSVGSLAIAPTNPDIVWVGTGETFVIRPAHAMGDDIYKSDDAGKTRKNRGLEKTGRIGRVIVHPNNPDIVYALFEIDSPALYRSEDFGETWTLQTRNHDINERAPYYRRMAVSTDNPDEVYFANVKFSTSKDGGKTIKGGYKAGGDNHDIWVDPTNADRIMVGHDGGGQY